MSKKMYHEARDLVSALDTETVAYQAWTVLMSRCYVMTPRKFKGFTVCSEWFDFQVFREWHDAHWFFGAHQVLWGSKVHSPESMSYVSLELHNIIGMEDAPYLWTDGWRVELTTLGYEKIFIGDYSTKREATLVRNLMKEGLVGYLRTKGDF